MKKRSFYTMWALGIASGSLLSGCWNVAPAPAPEKSAEVKPGTPVESVVDAATVQQKELASAKEMYDKDDGKQAFVIFQKYSDQGDVEATAWLGRCYHNGIGCAKNAKKAYECFVRAAEKNNLWGINGVGACCLLGDGTAKDLQRALIYFQRAAEMKHPLGTQNLARMYADHDNGFFSAELAEKYFIQARELKAPAADFYYALFLADQNRYREAIPLWEKLDDPVSMHKLIDCCQNGYGMPVDMRRAVQLTRNYLQKYPSQDWCGDLFFSAGIEAFMTTGITDFATDCIHEAARIGDPEAKYLLSYFYRQKKDEKTAFFCTWDAADSGHGTAILEVGKAFMNRKEFQRAVKYLTLATLNPFTEIEAVENLSSIYHYDLKQPDLAAHWDERGAALGVDFCRNELALTALKQWKQDICFAKAAALFAVGAQHKNAYATDWLQKIIKNDYERLRILADRGNADALFALAIYGINHSDPPMRAVGHNLLERAANANHPEACRMLGNLFDNRKDIKNALVWFQKAADLGDTDAACTVSRLMESDADASDDVIQKAYEKALELNDPNVPYWYGVYWKYRKNDAEKAKKYFEMAAARHDPRAMIELFRLLSEKDINAAWGYLQEAIQLCDSDACILAGDQFSSLNIPRSALHHYMLAHFFGDKSVAASRLAVCYLTGQGCTANAELFDYFAKMAYDNKDPGICLTLGRVYQEGKICARDLNRAKQYYEEGVKRGNEACKEPLAALSK